MFAKLKARWKVKSNLDLVLIFITFSAAGSASLIVRRPIFHLLGIDADTPFVLKALLYIVTVTPSYFVMLLVIGTILGQFKFFLAFDKKMINRFRRNKGGQAPSN